MSDIVCAERQRPDETMYHACLSEAQILDLASGFVPPAVKAQMIAFLDWQREDERKASRPYPGEKKKRRTA